MASKPRNRAGMDAETVARMMAAQDSEAATESPTVAPAEDNAAPPPEPAFDPGKIDGRTLRRTGREPFATRIKPETHEALRRIAYKRRITIAEAVEIAVAALDRD
ncbi:hypothetical protein [Methylobacterium sp.]|uniref:hypothetical protein n=1 Tax=Methylobacterium sp. TaxID=409 RepID=UPI0025CF8E74|nr:hypothetical protein [Methylobacterium sp.]MBY0256122.1 hypothetical protein [Methylobacterium sp.]